MTGPASLLSDASVGQRKSLTEGDSVSTIIRVVIRLVIVLTGSAIVFIGGTGGMTRAMETGNIGSATHFSALADGSGCGCGTSGFTWGLS
jgi:hypothetical protein